MSLAGTSVLRTEDHHLLVGDTRFVADVDLPGALHVRYVTSTVAHARLVRVDVDAARAVAGVVDVLVAADIDLAPLKPLVPTAAAAMVRPLLADGTVRFVGEPIAAVVAETELAAADAVALVDVEYDALPAVIDVEESRAGATLLFPEAGTNVVATNAGGAPGPLPFDECDVVVEADLVNQRVAPCPIETRVAASVWADDGRLTHYASCQGAHPIRTQLSSVLGLPPEQIRVVTADVGGSFGAKGRAYPEELLLPVIAKRHGRPARWAPDRSDDMVGLGHSRAQRQHVRIGGMSDGTIRCLEVHVLADCGAYPGIAPNLANNTGNLLPGPYRIPMLRWTNECVLTNTTPITAYRGAGRPEAAAIMDRAVDLFAAEVGLDAAAVRRTNLLRADEFPWSSPTGLTYDSGDYGRALDLALENAGYEALRAEQRRRRDAGERRLLGIGLSVFIDRTAGIPGSEYGSVELQAGGRVLVKTGSSPYGQGHYTAWAMLVADRTGLPMDRITVFHGDTDVVPRGGVTGGSRSAQKAGVAVAQATDALVAEAKRLAADLLEANPDDVVVQEGVFHVQGAPGAATVTWTQIASRVAGVGSASPPKKFATRLPLSAEEMLVADRSEGNLVANFSGGEQPAPERQAPRPKGPPAQSDGMTSQSDGVLKCEADFEGDGPTFPFGAYVAVVEVDTETGHVRLDRIVTVDDAGTILNPMLALGQVHGGLAQGIAQGMFEEFVYDGDGNPLTSTFADYMIPSAADLPSFESTLMETPSPNNPLGFKGIAESGTIGGPPAVQNAVVDALAHLGVRHLDLPITPERVWRARGGSPYPPGVLARLGRWSHNRRGVVLVAWVVALFVFGGLSGATGSGFSTAFSLPDVESSRGFDIIEEHFGGRGGGTGGNIVFRSDRGVDDPAVQAAMTEFLAEVAKKKPLQVTSPYSPEGAFQVARQGPEANKIAFAAVEVPNDFSVEDSAAITKEIQEVEPEMAGLQVEYGGQLFAEFAAPESEVLGLAFAIFILVLAFGSVLAMGLPIGTAIFGIGLGVTIVTILSNVITMPDFTTVLSVMIGLGVGIDYALFIVTRYREGLHKGLTTEDATSLAIDTAGRAVLFAGTTVVISLLGMLLMRLEFVNGLSIGAATTVVMTMLASVTLLPALLGFAGHRIEVTRWRGIIATGLVALALLGLGLKINAFVIAVPIAVVVLVAGLFVAPLKREIPRRARKPVEQTTAYRWSHLIQSRPWPAVALGVAALVALSIPLLSLRLGFSDEGNSPEDTSTRKAYDLLATGFGPGFNGPLILATELPGGAADLPAVEKLSAALRDAEGVAFASPGFPNDPADPKAALWRVIPDAAPQDEATSELVERLRADVIPGAVTGSDIDVAVTGFVAVSVDFSSYLGARLPLFIGVVLVLSFLLLMVVFRSILVPLKAVVMNLLSIGAAYGLVVAVFQWGWGKEFIGLGKGGPIEPFVPMMMFAIVFGLSMDYEVFLLSRVKEEYDRTGDNRNAVADGLTSTARVITAAAAIMVCVFGSFLLEPDRVIKLFGLGLASAVLLDATIVRMLLVPATMELLGDRNWWLPDWLGRWLPSIDVEGHANDPTLEGDPEPATA